MHVIIVLPLVCVTAFFDGISPADCGQLVKMLITLDHVIFGSNFAYTCILKFYFNIVKGLVCKMVMSRRRTSFVRCI